MIQLRKKEEDDKHHQKNSNNERFHHIANRLAYKIRFVAPYTQLNPFRCRLFNLLKPFVELIRYFDGIGAR